MTPYGFTWGPARVERMAHVEGRGYVLGVTTDFGQMQIYISETGRVIRSYGFTRWTRAQRNRLKERTDV